MDRYYKKAVELTCELYSRQFDDIQYFIDENSNNATIVLTKDGVSCNFDFNMDGVVLPAANTKEYKDFVDWLKGLFNEQ